MSTDTPERAATPLKVAVAEEIRALLGRREMSRIELARRIRKSHTYIGRRLSGEVAFDTDDLEQIAAVLGVKVADLFPRSARQVTVTEAYSDKGDHPVLSEAHPHRPGSGRPPNRSASRNPLSGPGRTAPVRSRLSA